MTQQHVTKWYPHNTGATFNSGSSLLITSGGGTATINGTVKYVPASVAVTTTLTVGTTMDVAGNFSVNTTYFTVAATTGNTAVAGTLNCVGNLAVNTTGLTVDATTGNTVASGTITTGLPASGKAITVDPNGATSTPLTNNVQLYTDGTNLYATKSDGQSQS
jgi:hypothetical protein